MTPAKDKTGLEKTTSERDRKLPHPLKIGLVGFGALKNFCRDYLNS
jgi:hypothetical protein